MASKKEPSASRQQMVPLSQVEAMVRARLHEIGAAAGVSHGRVGVEVLYMLPPQLVRIYELLWDLANLGEGGAGFGADTSGRAEEVAVAPDPKNMGGGGGGRTRVTDRSEARMAELVVRSGGSARRGSRGASRGSTGRVDGVGLAEAAEIKARADKRLRAVARDVAAELAALGLGCDLGTGELMVQMRGAGGMVGSQRRGSTGEAIADAIDNRASQG